MIEVHMNADDLAQSLVLAQGLGEQRNSILRGEGNQVGFLGKIAVSRLLKLPFHNTPHHDIVMGEGLHRTRIAVKTKSASFEPKPDYECSIAAASPMQDCDWYVFVRVKNDLSVAWVLGYYPRIEYFEVAKLLRKGEVVGDNGFEVKADCYNVPISALRPLPNTTMVDPSSWLTKPRR
jgi:hypothetical protein